MFFRNMILISIFMIFFFCSIGFAAGYESFGRRDPFVPLIGVPGAEHKGIWDVLTIEDVMIQGITVDPDGARKVFINGESMKEGDKKGLLLVESIGNNVVKIKLDEEYHELKLYEE